MPLRFQCSRSLIEPVIVPLLAPLATINPLLLEPPFLNVLMQYFASFFTAYVHISGPL